MAIELPNTSWVQRIDAAGEKLQIGFNEPKIVTVARAQHHPVFAQSNRAPVTVDGLVPHIENGQMKAASRCRLWCGVSVKSGRKIERIDRHHFDE